MIDFSEAMADIKRQRISTYSIAKRSGITRKTVSAWRRGVRNFRVDTIEAILDAIGYELKVVKKEDRL